MHSGAEFQSFCKGVQDVFQRQPVIHKADEAKHLCAAAILRKQSTKKLRNVVKHIWNLSNIGPPDFLVFDQGTAYTSNEMRESLLAHGAQLDKAFFKKPVAIGAVERYHALLRLAYEHVPAESDKRTTDQKFLDIAVFSLNWTVSPGGLCAALLVFGAVPRLAKMVPAPAQMERALFIDSCLKEVDTELTQSRISFGLKEKGTQEPKRHLKYYAETQLARPCSSIDHLASRERDHSCLYTLKGKQLLC